MSNNTVNWLSYPFEVCNHNSNWSNAAGVYIFCGVINGAWKPFYIGQAQSFKDRIPSHERWAEAVRLGASHVHARVVSQAATRDAIEQEMIRAYKPTLNTQHVP